MATQNSTNNITGSATKLTTARTLNGISFDGTANINIPIQNPTLGTTVVASAGQTVITSPTYIIGSNKLIVMINGFIRELTQHYTETSTTSITLTSVLDSGDRVSFILLI